MLLLVGLKMLGAAFFEANTVVGLADRMLVRFPRTRSHPEMFSVVGAPALLQ